MSAAEPPTADPEAEPEYVGAHSAVVADECQEWKDAEPESERFVPTKCGAEPTHTIVMKDASGLTELAMCDDCGEPEDVAATDRQWSADPSEDLRTCEACDTLNNTFVNPERCWKCGTAWEEQDGHE